MTFRIHALNETQFTKYFNMTAKELDQHGAVRQTVEVSPGSPCRVSMVDAEVGETIILLNYQHQPQNGPFQSSHAIFVRSGAKQAYFDIDQVPQVIQQRLVSMRVFDKSHMMIDADVVQGDDLAERLFSAFENKHAEYIHIHYAKPGCFAALVTRAISA